VKNGHEKYKLHVGALPQFCFTRQNLMRNKAECDKFSVSPSLSPIFVTKEEEGEESIKELDFTTTARSVVQTKP
jgi:hypothetical protein